MCIALKGGWEMVVDGWMDGSVDGWVGGTNKLTICAAKKVVVGFSGRHLFGGICIQEELGYIILQDIGSFEPV